MRISQPRESVLPCRASHRPPLPFELVLKRFSSVKAVVSGDDTTRQHCFHLTLMPFVSLCLSLSARSSNSDVYMSSMLTGNTLSALRRPEHCTAVNALHAQVTAQTERPCYQICQLFSFLSAPFLAPGDCRCRSYMYWLLRSCQYHRLLLRIYLRRSCCHHCPHRPHRYWHCLQSNAVTILLVGYCGCDGLIVPALGLNRRLPYCTVLLDPTNSHRLGDATDEVNLEPLPLRALAFLEVSQLTSADTHSPKSPTHLHRHTVYLPFRGVRHVVHLRSVISSTILDPAASWSPFKGGFYSWGHDS